MRDLHAAALGWQIIRLTTADIETNLKASVALVLEIADTRKKQIA